MNQDFMRTKPILPLVLSMSLPMMLSMLINSLYNIVDSLFVGRYAESGLTALSIIYPIQLLMMALAIGTGVGINTAMAARFPLFIRCRHSSFPSEWVSAWELTRQWLFLWEREKRRRLTGRRPRGFF